MFPPRDLRLERLDRPRPLSDIAKVGASVAGDVSSWERLETGEALNNAVFTASGAFEWLSGLRRAVAAFLGNKTPIVPVSPEAIHTNTPV